MPKSCNECKFDLRTDICQAFCEWNAEHPYSIRATDRLPDCPLSEAPEPCEDAVSRQAAIDAIKKSRFLVDAMEKNNQIVICTARTAVDSV